ncbi:MAG: ATP-binding protein DrrA1-3 family domain-containing protein, partial [Methanobacterium sp.]
ITVLLTTHYMDEADNLCDKISIIDKGNIVTTNSPKNLKRELKADTITLMVDDPEKFQNLAKDLDFIKEMFVMDGEIKLMVERGENLITRLVNFTDKNGIGVKSVELEHPNLEDVFISYTGSSMKGGK